MSTRIPNMSKATPKIILVTISATGKPTKMNSRIIPDIIKYIPITKIKSNNIKANTIKLYLFFFLSFHSRSFYLRKISQKWTPCQMSLFSYIIFLQ